MNKKFCVKLDSYEEYITGDSTGFYAWVGIKKLATFYDKVDIDTYLEKDLDNFTCLKIEQ